MSFQIAFTIKMEKQLLFKVIRIILIYCFYFVAIIYLSRTTNDNNSNILYSLVYKLIVFNIIII